MAFLWVNAHSHSYSDSNTDGYRYDSHPNSYTYDNTYQPTL